MNEYTLVDLWPRMCEGFFCGMMIVLLAWVVVGWWGRVLRGFGSDSV